MSSIRDTVAGLAMRLTRRGARCKHLDQVMDGVTPRSEGCEECLAAGARWVHLRMCLSCGHVGCCMASEGKHALAHFDATGHAIMRSLEPGEAWRYCWVEWRQLDP